MVCSLQTFPERQKNKYSFFDKPSEKNNIALRLPNSTINSDKINEKNI